jgi:hypothetical protein|tara:strand:- start:1129 stop:1497 length:369 start_codon:yes stop_codon:yes gene_type:complete
MYESLIKQTQKAIEHSLKWAETGWGMTFGDRQVNVGSLKEAEELPPHFVYREDALNYWKQVQLTGSDAAASGKKALAALEREDFKGAEDFVYCSMYHEKPFAAKAKTWKLVYDAVKQEMSKS